MRKIIDIQLNDNHPVPKYRQIIDPIQQKIKTGDLKKGNKKEKIDNPFRLILPKSF